MKDINFGADNLFTIKTTITLSLFARNKITLRYQNFPVSGNTLVFY